ncbi:MAG TPA: SUMF1/EgtB/PvdO family nonheme iron enzyme [Acidimicrobiales bacterium]|nr:SUMF1/EgtB/PvdO family nonheme iron enzyme [Acidimicrobiales bacterium]
MTSGLELDDFSSLAHPPAAAGTGTYVEWLRGLEKWRRDAHEATGYNPARYLEPATAWTSTSFTCGMVMLWDESLRAGGKNRLSIAGFLYDARSRFGGLDSVVLWHAYPRYGFDDRNQFDFYRELPGGLDGLRSLVTECHELGTRAFLAYYPWDPGLRPEPGGRAAALVRILLAAGADGIFLDTESHASSEFISTLHAESQQTVLMTEDFVPLDKMDDHLMSWAQWPPEENGPYLLKNRWFEPRHMQLLVRRWHRDHSNELHLAWLNGAGVVVWENVFGSENPWSEKDSSLLRQMRPVQRTLGALVSEGEWLPLVPTYQDGVFASVWQSNGLRLWAVANMSDHEVSGPLVEADGGPADAVWDLTSGRQLRLSGTAGMLLEGELGPREVGAFAAASSSSAHPRLAALLRQLQDARAKGSGSHRSSPDSPSRQTPAQVTTVPAAAPQQFGELSPAAGPQATATPSGMRSLTVRYRLRECGMDGPAPLANAVFPKLHEVITEERLVPVSSLTAEVAERPVTNAEFLVFLKETGYVPASPDNFVRHWGAPLSPSQQQLGSPVVFVDLGDAEAYCTWAGKRLPTPEEWQVAMEDGAVGYGASRVWEWTQPLHSDGHTRYCVLKGGSSYLATGSDWYADSGPQSPDWRAKFISYWPGLDRSSTIGFRCAALRGSLDREKK